MHGPSDTHVLDMQISSTGEGKHLEMSKELRMSLTDGI